MVEDDDFLPHDDLAVLCWNPFVNRMMKILMD